MVSLLESLLRRGRRFSFTNRSSYHLAIGGSLYLPRNHSFLFRPKVDEISLLTVNSSTFFPGFLWWVLVAFAGRKYAARSIPAFVANGIGNFVCLNNQDCAMRTSSCKTKGGKMDCSLGIQIAFSGTDKHESVFNSWYEVKNLGEFSLFGLYKSLKDSLTS